MFVSHNRQDEPRNLPQLEILRGLPRISVSPCTFQSAHIVTLPLLTGDVYYFLPPCTRIELSVCCNAIKHPYPDDPDSTTFTLFLGDKVSVR